MFTSERFMMTWDPKRHTYDCPKVGDAVCDGRYRVLDVRPHPSIRGATTAECCSIVPMFRPSITAEEEAAVLAVLRSGWLGTGREVEAFEREFGAYIGVPAEQCIATNSCTAALRVACELGLQNRVCSALTFVADPEAMMRNSFKPLALDVGQDTLCAEPQRHGLHVHYAGYPTPAEDAAVEDCAHAMGANTEHNRSVGTMARFGCFSFHAVKNLTTGDGGMLVCNRPADAPLARALLWHGIDRGTYERTGPQRYSWQYDVVQVGEKGRMNDLAAALGRVQLRRLDGMLTARERIAEHYQSELRGVRLPAWHNGHAWHLYVIRHPERDKLAAHLNSRGICTGVHYRPWTEYRPYRQATPPVVAREWPQLLSLPMYPDMTEGEADQVCCAVNEFTTAGG